MEFETILQSDMSKPVQVKQLTGNFFSGDNKANKITVELFKDGSPYELMGDISAYVIREDKKTVVIADTQGTHYTEKDGNKYSVILPQSAYVAVGQVSIVIKVGTVTVGACTSYVYKTTTDQQIDPGSVVPDISTLMGIIEDCIGATEAAESATLAAQSITAQAGAKITEINSAILATSSAIARADTATLASTSATAKANTATLAAQSATAGANTATAAAQSATALATAAAGEVNSAILAASSATAHAESSALAATSAAAYAVEVADDMESEILRLDNTKASNDSVYYTKTKSGSLITVDDAVAEAVKQLRIEIAPVQDLHGYNSPWPAGGGANKFDPSEEVSGKIINGSGDEENRPGMRHSDYIPVISGESYYVLMNGTAGIYGVIWFDSNKAYLGKAFAGEVSSQSVTAPSGAYFAIINYNPSTNPNVAFNYPATVITYAPYSNICPISGWTGANVSRTGKNLLPVKFYTGFGYNDTVGQIRTLVADESVTKNGNVFSKTVSSWGGTGMVSEKLKPGTYKCNIAVSADTAGDTRSSLYVFDENFKIIRRIGNLQTSGTWTNTITISEGEAYIAVNVSSTSTGTVTITSPQIELGSIKTDYEPYQGNQYSITFPAAAGTVYGGELTINRDGTGSLVVDRASVDMGTLTWNASSGAYYSTDLASIIKLPESTSVIGNYISSALVQIPANTTLTANKYAVAQNGRLWAKDETSATASAFKSAMSGVQLVYELATPVTYTLTTDQVPHLLSGKNNVWADCGEMTMLYPTLSFYTKDEGADRIYDTVTNQAMASFPDGANGIPVKRLEAAVKPVQDLHGYENPWPAGGGKNLLPMTVELIKAANTSGGTWNGNTFTANDGISYTLETNATGAITGIKVNGTASGNSSFVIADLYGVLTDNVSYTLNGCPNGGSSSKYSIYIYNTPQYTVDARDTGSGVTFTSNSDATNYKARIYIQNGQTVSNMMFYPMIRLSSVSDATFAPYENICPISGWDSANVGVAEHYSPLRPDFTNEFTQNGVTFNVKNYPFIDVKGTAAGGTAYSGTIGTTFQSFKLPAGTYKLKTIGDISSVNIVVQFSSGSGLSNVTLNANNPEVTFTFADEYGIGWYLNVQNGTTADAHFALVYSTGKVYSITFPPEAGTVYGGTLTVNKDGTGTLVVDKAVVDLGSLDYTKYDVTQGALFRGPISGVTTVTASGYAPNFICSMYPVVSTSERYNKTVSQAVSNPSVDILDNDYSDATTFKTAMSGVKLVYELATPVTYNLTDLEVIETLKGINNVWADTGNILELNYAADTKLYISKELDASRKLMELIITANHEDNMKATKAYTTGNLLIVNGTLYKATTSIANGATLTVGTNVTATTVAAEIAALS